MMDVPSGNVQNHKINLKYVRNLLAKIKSPRTRDGNCNQEALNPFVCSRAFDSLFHFALWNLIKELAELKPLVWRDKNWERPGTRSRHENVKKNAEALFVTKRMAWK